MASETKVFVYTMSELGKVGAWTRYVFPCAVTDWAILGDTLYLHTGQSVMAVTQDAVSDQDASGATLPVEAVIQGHYLDLGSPGVTKQVFGFDLSGNGTARISFGLNQNDMAAFTGEATVPADTVPGMVIPCPLMTPSVSVRIRFSSDDNPDGWEWLGTNLYLQDMRRTS